MTFPSCLPDTVKVEFFELCLDGRIVRLFPCLKSQLLQDLLLVRGYSNCAVEVPAPGFYCITIVHIMHHATVRLKPDPQKHLLHRVLAIIPFHVEHEEAELLHQFCVFLRAFPDFALQPGPVHHNL